MTNFRKYDEAYKNSPKFISSVAILNLEYRRRTDVIHRIVIFCLLVFLFCSHFFASFLCATEIFKKPLPLHHCHRVLFTSLTLVSRAVEGIENRKIVTRPNRRFVILC